MTIGEKIKDFRKLNNLTQVELAKKSNISRSYLADIEKDRYNASLETLKSIADSLGVSVSALIEENMVIKLTAGEKLKKIRESQNLTRKDLAKLSGISESTITATENNLSEPNSNTLIKLAEALNVNATYLLPDNNDVENILKSQELNEKDKKSITKDLKVLMDEFREGTDGAAYYNGQELAEEDLDLIESAMKIALEQIKIKNKDKYTPNKYRK